MKVWSRPRKAGKTAAQALVMEAVQRAERAEAERDDLREALSDCNAENDYLRERMERLREERERMERLKELRDWYARTSVLDDTYGLSRRDTVRHLDAIIEGKRDDGSEED